MRLKLTGLDVEIEGERSDIPRLGDNISRQITGIIDPAVRIAGGNSSPESKGNPEQDNGNNDKGKGRRTRRFVQSKEVTSATAQPIDWRHDPAQWGSPNQGWSIKKKILWLLYVVEQATDQREMTGPAIPATFNKHFRQAGQLRGSLSNRELGRAKSAIPPLVGEDTTKTPSAWFLLDAGRAEAVELVKEAKGGATTGNGEE